MSLGTIGVLLLRPAARASARRQAVYVAPGGTANSRPTEITMMPDPEPSDASGYQPVNRIALLTEYGMFEAVGIPPPEPGPIGAAGRVINLDEPEGVTDLVPALNRATR